MSLFENTHDFLRKICSARRIAMRLREVFKKNILALTENGLPAHVALRKGAQSFQIDNVRSNRYRKIK